MKYPSSSEPSRPVRLLARVAVLVLMAACTGDDTWTALSEEPPPADWTDLRRRMNIRVTGGQSGNQELTPREVVAEAAFECMGLLTNPPLDGGEGQAINCSIEFNGFAGPLDGEDLVTGDCRDAACIGLLGICTANRLEELAETPAPANLGFFVVPPQSNESRAALHERAAAVSRETIFRIVDALGNAVGESGTTNSCLASDVLGGDGTDSDLWIPDIPGTAQTLGESLAASLVEAYDLLDAATDGAVQRNFAAADAHLSEQPSHLRGARFAQQAPVLSRGHVAHLLVGPYTDGDPAENGVALPALGDRPFNSAQPLTQRDRVALQAIREAAPRPATLRLEGGVTFDEMLTGTPGVDGSIRERLEELYGMALPTDPDEFLDYLGTDRESFENAGRLVVNEMRSFDRDDSITMPVRDLVGGATTGFTRWATTGRAPVRLPASRWALLAQKTSVSVNDATAMSFVAGAPGAAYARRGVTRTRDYALTWAANIMRDGAAAAVPLPERSLDVLAHLVGRAAEDRPARMELAGSTTTNVGKVRLLGAGVEEVVLVRGTAGLSCAVLGHVEGEPCGAAEFASYQVSGGMPIDPSSRTGFTQGVEWTVDGMLPPDSSDETEEFYAVTPTSGGSPIPGGFSELGGVAAHAQVGEPAIAVMSPFDPEREAVIREGIEAAIDRAAPVNRCARLQTNRIPLENELSEDGDSFESSWRSYLGLAAAASAEADNLGERLIEQGLEMDRRAEGAAEELERLCGGTIDLDLLEPPPATGHYAGPCVMGACADGYACGDGGCVWDPMAALRDAAVTDPEAARLTACLGSEGTHDLVSLGTRPLCVWRGDLLTNDVCGGTSTDTCPFFIGENGTTTACTEYTDQGPGFSVLEVPERLALFESTGEGSDADAHPMERAEVCAAVRVIRTPSSTMADRNAALRTFQSSRVFAFPDMRNLARGLSWRPEARNFSTITRNGKRWITTGSLAAGPGTEWPCGGSAPDVDCAPGAAGFFCNLTASACDDVNRPIQNDRMGRAVLAARVITAAGLDDMRFPGFFRGTLNISERLQGVRADWQGAAVGNIYYSVREDIIDPRRREQAQFLYLEPGTLPAPPIWTTLRSHTTPISLVMGLPTTTPGGLLRGDSVFVTAQPRDDRLRDRSIGRARGVWMDMPGNPRTRTGGISSDGRIYSVLLDVATRADGEMINTLARGTAADFSDYWNNTSSYAMIERDRNEAMLAPEGLSTQDVLDAVELLCQAPVSAPNSPSATAACAPPAVTGVDDMPELRRFMGCVADQIEQRGERTVLANIPVSVVDVVNAGGGVGAFPRLGGEFGAGATRLRQGLIEMQAISPMIATEIRSFGTTIEQFELTVDELGIRDELSTLSLASTISSQSAACIASASGVGAVSSAGGAVATCANALIQIGIAIRRNTLEEMSLDIAEAEALNALMDRFYRTTQALEGLMTSLRQIQETIDGGLATIETTQRQASRAVARATFADTDDAGRQFNVNTVSRRRMNTLQARYDDARDHAIRMAHLARVAVEQRLGMDLSTLDRDLSLVDNPSTWVDTVCTMDGIDYGRIRDTREPEFEDFSAGYIGDYVNRLERVVESYRLDFPFHDGSDTAVVSLRDDVLRVRSTVTADGSDCRVPSRNQLYQSSNLLADEEVDVTGAVTDHGWRADGCEPLLDGNTPNCTDAVDLGEATEELTTDRPSPRGFRVSFGKATELGLDADELEGSFRWDATHETRFVQEVALEPSRQYRLSYYGRQVTDGVGGALGPDPIEAVHVLDAAGDPLTPASATATAVPTGWTRYHSYFDTFASVDPETYRVVVEPDPALGAPALWNQAIDVGGFMVEEITFSADGAAASLPGFDPVMHPPPSYVGTDDQLMVRRRACEDTHGDVFRTRMRPRRCEVVCPPGRETCSSADLGFQCFQEIDFTISLDELERGELLGLSGFARGNFNYRVDRIGVNFVGTNVRDCSESTTPTTCFSAGWVPYTLVHRGDIPRGTDSGFSVSNHLGEIYSAPLFNGWIVHARGLNAERQLTNPISSADRALIEPFTHSEFRGRPLAGRYTIRIWDDPTVRFENLEDVQIVLDYRYWTRLD